MKRFQGKTYDYNGIELGIIAQDNGKIIIGYKSPLGCIRKFTDLPFYNSVEQAQQWLDRYASTHSMKGYERNGRVQSVSDSSSMHVQG